MDRDETVIYRGKIVDLCHQKVLLPNGATAELEIVRHPGGAAAVAIDNQNRVCLLRQYRHVVGGWLWELPAGKLESGEAPESAIQRELEEEAGLRAARWDFLGSIITSPGVFTEIVHLFRARELSSVPTRQDTHEVIEIHWVPLSEAMERARSGDIVDAKTVAGLFRATTP